MTRGEFIIYITGGVASFTVLKTWGGLNKLSTASERTGYSPIEFVLADHLLSPHVITPQVAVVAGETKLSDLYLFEQGIKALEQQAASFPPDDLASLANALLHAPTANTNAQRRHHYEALAAALNQRAVLACH